LPIILITKKPTNIKEYVIHFVRTGNFFKAYKLLTNSCEEEKKSQIHIHYSPNEETKIFRMFTSIVRK
jgi:hypothetical protein